MSTKTSIKRIALVAVSALGFGLLSVVPAKATAGDITMTFDFTSTGSTASPEVGAAVVVPVTLATSSIDTDADGATGTLTATLTTKPTNSALDTEGATTASVTLNAFPEAEATIAATASTASVGAKLTATYVGTDLTQAATVIGAFGFTPDVPGKYVMTLAVSDTDKSGGGTTTSSITTSTVEIIVSGAGLVQAASGLGSTAGTQNVGSQSAAAFFLPATSTTTDVYTVTATGASILGAYRATTTDAANANSYTSTTGIVKQDGSTFASGISYTGQTTVTAVTGTSDAADALIIQFTSATAGAATVTLKSVNSTTGISTTVSSVTVQYGAAPTVNAAQSLVYIGQGNTRPTAVETTAISVPSTAGVTLSSTATSGATIRVSVKDASGNAIVGQAITATITGAGLITLAEGTGTGSTGSVRTASLTATAMASSADAVIGVSADGTRGVGTITITAGGVTLATKTVTFYGAVASLTATQNLKIARSGRAATSTTASFTLGSSTAGDASTTVATTPAVTIVAKDVDGNVVPGVTVTADIADALVLSTVNVTDCTGGAALTNCAAGAGNYVSNVVSAIGGVSGASTTVTYKTPHPTVAGTFITSDPITFTLGGSKTGGTVTMSLDKATYAPGERMVLTITAKDASGNPVYDGTATGTPAANKSVIGLTGDVFYDGEYVFGDEAGENLYAPTASGSFTLTLSTGTATGATIDATATVGDDAATSAAAAAADAAAEAIDAANAATDAANLAAEAADAATVAAEEARDAADAATAAVEDLASQVATLMAALKAQITTLANTVAKIAKKVKA